MAKKALLVEIEKLRRSIHRLTGSLKRISKDPTSEDVHKLRTEIRRLEAILSAIKIEDKAVPDRLLKLLAPIRKASGHVRDMDVLIVLTLSLSKTGADKDRAELLGRLRIQRVEAAIELSEKIENRRKRLDRRLAATLKLVNETIIGEQPGRAGSLAHPLRPTISVVGKLTRQLGEWPQLKRSNIHSFRLKVKKLRYIMQFARRGNSKAIRALGRVKDAIGLWHDWSELERFAGEILEEGKRSCLVEEIGDVAHHYFALALDASIELRTSLADLRAESA